MTDEREPNRSYLYYGAVFPTKGAARRCMAELARKLGRTQARNPGFKADAWRLGAGVMVAISGPSQDARVRRVMAKHRGRPWTPHPRLLDRFVRSLAQPSLVGREWTLVEGRLEPNTPAKGERERSQ